MARLSISPSYLFIIVRIIDKDKSIKWQLALKNEQKRATPSRPLLPLPIPDESFVFQAEMAQKQFDCQQPFFFLSTKSGDR